MTKIRVFPHTTGECPFETECSRGSSLTSYCGDGSGLSAHRLGQAEPQFGSKHFHGCPLFPPRPGKLDLCLNCLPKGQKVIARQSSPSKNWLKGLKNQTLLIEELANKSLFLFRGHSLGHRQSSQQVQSGQSLWFSDLWTCLLHTREKVSWCLISSRIKGHKERRAASALSVLDLLRVAQNLSTRWRPTKWRSSQELDQLMLLGDTSGGTALNGAPFTLQTCTLCFTAYPRKTICLISLERESCAISLPFSLFVKLKRRGTCTASLLRESWWKGVSTYYCSLNFTTTPRPPRWKMSNIAKPPLSLGPRNALYLGGS